VLSKGRGEKGERLERSWRGEGKSEVRGLKR